MTYAVLMLLFLVGCADQRVANSNRTVFWKQEYSEYTHAYEYEVWYHDRLDTLPDTLWIVIPKGGRDPQRP
jgi:hypothetical protein